MGHDFDEKIDFSDVSLNDDYNEDYNKDNDQNNYNKNDKNKGEARNECIWLSGLCLLVLLLMAVLVCIPIALENKDGWYVNDNNLPSREAIISLIDKHNYYVNVMECPNITNCVNVRCLIISNDTSKYGVFQTNKNCISLEYARIGDVVDVWYNDQMVKNNVVSKCMLNKYPKSYYAHEWKIPLYVLAGCSLLFVIYCIYLGISGMWKM